jgi:hypothetical protein
MKRYFNIRHFTGSLLAGLLLGTSSCQKSLKEDVYSFVVTDNFYKTSADAEAAIIAAYQPFTNTNYFKLGFYNLCLLADDEVTIGRNPQFQAVDNFNLTPDHAFTSTLWTEMYNCINRANIGISRLPAIPMDANRKAVLIAECQFIRAYNYFNLVRLFGGVPLSTKEIQSAADANNPKATAQQIYQQIISDLKAAETVLPATRTSAEVGRATQGAAKTLLADVYLTTEQWTDAASKSKEVMQANTYQLLPDFASIFSVSNENNAEIIFAIQFDGPINGNSMASYSQAGGTDNPNCANGAQVWSVDTNSDMWKTWDTNDSRRNFTVYDKFTNKSGKVIDLYTTARPFPAFGKYNAPNETSQGNCPLNPDVYRYADVLLIYAEAASQAAGTPPADAYDAVNMVRRRAYKKPLTTVSTVDLPAGLSKDAFRQAVLKERSLEFVIENRRLFDLMRTGQFPSMLKSLGKTINEKATLFPIPLAEMNTNTALKPTDQNPGY